jgi:hypothetical protein
MDKDDQNALPASRKALILQEPVYSIQLHVSAHSCAQCRWKQCSKTKQNQNAQWAGILGGLAHCAMSPMNFSLAASEGYAGEKIK